MVYSAAFFATLALLQVSTAFSKYCKGTCTYKFHAEVKWTAARHPTDYPANAHWSPFWTVAHDSTFMLWKKGSMANAGIQEIAEFGSGESFMKEVEDCGGSCGAPEGFSCDPFSGMCMASGMVVVTPDMKYISTASMIAPSPDWFIGIDSMDMCPDGKWIDDVSKVAYPYDAGTDAGETFAAPDAVSNPKMPVTLQEMGPGSIFYNAKEGFTYPMGMMKLELVECEANGSYGNGWVPHRRSKISCKQGAR